MKNILRILRVSKPLYGLIAFLAILILIVSVLELVTPVISGWIVDEIVRQVNDGTGNIDTLAQLILISFIVSFASTFATSVSNRLGDHFAGRIRKFLTEKFYDKVLTLPQSYFDGEMSGKIVNQLNRGIVSIQGFMNTSTNFILPSILQSAFTIILLAYYDLGIALFVFLLFPVYIGISTFSTIRWGRHEEKKNAIEDANRGRIQEVIYNIKLVKTFTNELAEYGLVSKNLGNINKIYAKQSNEFHLFDFTRNFSLLLILLVVNIIAFYNTFNGLLTIGELVIVLQLVAQARIPLFGMSYILGQIQMAETGSKEYFQILELESKEKYDLKKDFEPLESADLEFSDVSFKYDDDTEVLQQINFKLKHGQTVALVGPSGAGKSTIANLILKLYEATTGSILLNGKRYQELDTKYIRENVSLVLQDNELFSSSIRENVAYGQEATDQEIITALKKAYAWEFVEKLKDGIDAQIGERGVRLSGGQKQRIQIARAILKNAPILILDEATSSLDAKSEAQVQQALENLMKNRLVIIIAHRFSTIQNADHILVLDNHKITDAGSPQELAKRSGIYQELLNYQVEGNKKLLEKFEIF